MVNFLSEPSLYFDESVRPLFFLRPSNPADGPAPDSVINGTLVLAISRPREVKEITAELIGRQSLWVSGRHDSYETLRRSITLRPGWLEEGQHRFECSFVAPANTAPHDIGVYGKTVHQLKATAAGLGRFGKDLVADSDVYLIAGDSEPGVIADGYDRSREMFHDVLGPFRGRFHTKYLLRGGYLRFTLNLPAVAQKVIIEDVQAILCQNHNLQSMKNPHLVELVPSLIALWSLRKEGAAPLTLDEGKDLSLVRQLRLMAEDNLDMVRPTTSDWSETGIRIAHQLLIVVRFRQVENNPDKEVKELKMPFEAKLSSCATSLENCQLPEYSAIPPHVKQSKKDREAWNSDCLCYRPTTAQLEAVYGSDLKTDKDDQYGYERNRQPPWLLKSQEGDAE